MATKAIQIRNAMAAAIQEITAAWCTTNGYSAGIALPDNASITGNFVSPFDRRSFPYVHTGHPKSDYRGVNTMSSDQVPHLTLEIAGFVKDSTDAEALADELGQAIIARITADNKLGGLAIDTLYNEIEAFESGETGLAMVRIEADITLIHVYGDTG